VRLFPLATTVARVAAVRRSDFGIPEGRPAFAAGWDTYSGFARKGGLSVLRAFEAALAFGVEATLVIKLNNNGPRRHPQLERALERLPPDRVVVIEGYLPYEQVLGLYSLCDAYISLHRAEGLGLGMQEAMLLGKPVIATGWSGNMDFMDSSCASIVSYCLTPMIDDNPEYVSTNFSRAQFWAEPDILDAARRIQHLAEDPAARHALGRAAQRRALAYHAAWKRAAPEVLAELYQEHA
jgi:glycosyltransferase involved in cell wall biosynthesis